MLFSSSLRHLATSVSQRGHHHHLLLLRLISNCPPLCSNQFLSNSSCLLANQRLHKICSFFSSKMASSQYSVVERGVANTESYRLFLVDAQTKQHVSPFHDIPYVADAEQKHFHMVVEIPRWSNAKMEIATKEPLNPIKQDVKKGALRYVKNVYPHHGYIWNYGAIPQTWENPDKKDAETGFNGDNDPIDVCEIGSKIHPRGAVIKVKVLGCFALIDEGETDWKIIVIDVDDPLASQLNDIEDVNKLMPGLLQGTHEWFKIYKIPDGKPANEFAFKGQAKDRKFALKVIEETHQHWKELIDGQATNSTGLSLKNVTLSDSGDRIENAAELLEQTAAFSSGQSLSVAEQQQVDKWYFVTL